MKAIQLLTCAVIILIAGGAIAQPAPPDLLSPECGERGVSVRPLFDWSDANSVCTPPITYDLDVFIGNDACSDLGIAPVISLTGLTASQYQVTSSQQFPKNTVVCYRVRARDGCGIGAWSECCCFITER